MTGPTGLLAPATTSEAVAWARDVLRTRRRAFLGTVVVFGLAALAGLAGPQLLGVMVDEVERALGGGADDSGSTGRIDLLGLAFLGALLVTAALRCVARRRTGVLGEELLAANREQLVGRALALPLGTVESVGTGALLSRATTDLERVDYATRHAVPSMVVAAVTAVITVVAMVVTSPLLALGLLAALPTLVPPTRRFLRRVPPVMRRMLDAWSVVQSRTHESAAGARTLDTLGLLGRRREADERHLGDAVDGELGLRSLHVRWAPWLEVSHALPVAAMLLLGLVAHSRGLVDLGTVATMVLYAQSLNDPLDEVLWWSEDLLVSATALRRVLGVRANAAHQRCGTADDRCAQPPTDHREAGLHVSGLHYGYRADRPVLHGVDLVVPPGERLAIVGGSGAGKSTLARLIAGVAAPDRGSVRLDGQEVATLPETELRRRVLLLTQEHHVFAGTVRENLLLPAGSFTDDDLARALDLVGLGPWHAALPDGLDTVLGAGAHAVPAAGAQQLALARVVLADPGTVVLDEATSLLDTAAARATERALERVLAGRTVIAIAHRLHTAAAADRVAVMAAGRVVELGAPADLAVADGPYGRLLRASAGEVPAQAPP